MKKQRNKEDMLVSRMMADFSPEDAPVGFTERVMQRVRLSEGAVRAYQPLIGRNAWIMIGAILLVVIVLALMTAGPAVQEPGSIGGILAEKSIQLPEWRIGELFSWLIPDTPQSFWIFISISSLIALVILERFINNLRKRYDYQSR